MLTEQRYDRILGILERRGSVTTSELMAGLGASESTVRRDLNALAREGKLVKVHGGAVAAESGFAAADEEVRLRETRNIESKVVIARYAAGLIRDDDFVYLDAGTTTALMIDEITAESVTFVTNSLEHAKRLVKRGYTCYLPGGEFKSVTEAIVGEEAVLSVGKYNFTKGFFGANGVTEKSGFTTPEVKEALVKKAAMKACRERYVLADSSKFDQTASVSFGAFTDATVLTTGVIAKPYAAYDNVLEVN